jgi:hypothetical protein
LVHGGKDHTGEDLYLRTWVALQELPDKVWLNVETLDPGGEIWVNGSLVAVARDRHPMRIDIGSFLQPNTKNLLALKVYANDPDMISRQLPHSGSDNNIGWFAGKMHLDLTNHAWIDDVFVHTVAIADSGEDKLQVMDEEFNAETAGQVPSMPANQATVKVCATISNRDSEARWQGFVRFRLYPWLPEESNQPVSEIELPVDCCEWCDQTLTATMTVDSPNLWTWQSPSLYKVEAVLTDGQHSAIDDYVLTTGLRTISQTGAMLRINDQPEMLNGAQIFGLRSPLEKTALWQRRPPVEWLVREIAQVRRMNGNAIRIHVHAWAHVPPARGINDVRLAEIGDQLGMMFYWTTTSWIRSGTPWGTDLEGLPKYIKQVRNHPSIVLWELANHPTCNQLYERGDDGWNQYYQRIHDIIYPLDPSRLIAPMAIVGEGSNQTPALDLPGMVRGNMDCPTGMGAEWSSLREFIERKQVYMNRQKNRAYFNFEHQESIGQPNWSLCRGKPWHKVMSYEWHSDEGSIGRKLTADEWRESQAWQSFSAYEAMRTMRQIGYDGFSWCCLHGGPNTATYKKPLIDFLGYPKLAWYAHRMVFQRILAGSSDVDTVYGPDDRIHPVICNLGENITVTLEIVIKDVNNTIIDQCVYEHIRLPAGRGVTNLPAFRPQNVSDGNYGIEYLIRESQASINS